MCGIAGIFRFDDVEVRQEDLVRMTNSIVHRGPDGEGQWINEQRTIGFGHRRLSIIDLTEGGHQPMHYQNRYSITFNGEIYNYLELKSILQSKGYSFSSESDTEVLLALYADKGIEMLSELDGMFAFAIWDKEKEELFCARDRFGEKPFFYALDQSKFVFGSEMKELWAFGIPKKIKEDRLYQYILSGIVESNDTITDTYYSGIQKLDASHYIILDKKGRNTIKKYWSLDTIQVNQSISFDDAKDRYFELFKNSVQMRLRSDVPVGSSLSGGLDSSSIVLMIDQLKREGQKQKVFSARFKNFEKDEGTFIEEVINRSKNIEAYNTWPVEQNLTDFVEKVAHHQEEPFGSSSIVAQWSVMQLAKENNVTVLMDGQGADEFLAGYVPEYQTYLTQLFFENRKLYKKEFENYQDNFGKTRPVKRYTDSETWRMKVGRLKKQMMGQEIGYDKLKDRLKYKLTSAGLKELLRYSDRNSMAHSREVRLPFLSHQLVEFVFSLPDSFLIHDGWTKYIHRKSLENILPSKITWRKDKLGYEPPQKRWMENPEIKEVIKSQQKHFDIPEEQMVSASYTNSMDWKLFVTSYFLD